MKIFTYMSQIFSEFSEFFCVYRAKTTKVSLVNQFFTAIKEFPEMERTLSLTQILSPGLKYFYKNLKKIPCVTIRPHYNIY
jgi:hypothetical protein